jgi:putative inorganic carbon (hco3(-)) transporter
MMGRAHTRSATLWSPRVRGDLAWAIAASLPLAVAAVAFSHLTAAWFVLLLCGLLTAVVVLWWGDLETALAFMTAMTFPIDITKALVVEEGLYAPALYLVLSDVFLLPALACWIWERTLAHPRRLALSAFHYPALAFLAWTWVSALHSHRLLGGVCAAILYTKFFLIFLWLTDHVASPKQLRTVLLGLAAGLGLNLLFAFAQLLSGSLLTFQGAKAGTSGTSLVFASAGGLHTLRPYGFLQHPNVLASFLTFLLPSLLSVVMAGRRYIKTEVWAGLVALLLGSLAALAVTLSRGGWVACVASFLFVFLVGLRRRLVSRAQLVGASALVVAAALAAAVVYPALYLRLTDSDEHATTGRLFMMNQALLVAQVQPLVGVGIGSYNFVSRFHVPSTSTNIPYDLQQELQKGVVHNKYLLTLAESGAIGLLVFLYLFYRALAAFFRVRRWRSPVDEALGLGLAGAIVAHLVFFQFDHFYVDVRIGLLFVTFGLLSALVRLQSLPSRLASR